MSTARGDAGRVDGGGSAAGRAEGDGLGDGDLVEAIRARADGDRGVLVELVAAGRSLASDVAAGIAGGGPDVDAVVSELAQRLKVAPREAAWGVLAAALDTPFLLTLDPRRAGDVVLRLLSALAPMRDASVWVAAEGDPLHAVAFVGPAPSRRTAAVAAATVAGTPPQTARAAIHGVPVVAGSAPVGALVYRCAAADAVFVRLCAEHAAETLGPVVARERLLVRSSDRERVLLEAGERRLRRLALDLHDGPLQHLAGLRGEIALLRTQARSHLDDGGGEVAARLVGRLDDLEARTVAADDLLRDICRSIVAPAVPGNAVDRLLHDEASRFASETGTSVDLTTSGDLAELTHSASLAVIRIVQEALSNVREHSGARTVRIRVDGAPDEIRVEVHDDGCGFEPEPTMRLASARGRLGLTGMAERARLLGGTFTILSSPGGPTRIVAAFPRWRPLARANDDR